VTALTAPLLTARDTVTSVPLNRARTNGAVLEKGIALLFLPVPACGQSIAIVGVGAGTMPIATILVAGAKTSSGPVQGLGNLSAQMTREKRERRK